MDHSELLKKIALKKIQPFCDLLHDLIPEFVTLEQEKAFKEIPNMEQFVAVDYEAKHKNSFRGIETGTILFQQDGANNVKLLELIFIISLVDMIRSSGCMYDLCSIVYDKIADECGDDYDEYFETILNSYEDFDELEGLTLEEIKIVCISLLTIISKMYSYKTMKKFNPHQILYTFRQVPKFMMFEKIDELNEMLDNVTKSVKAKKKTTKPKVVIKEEKIEVTPKLESEDSYEE